MLPSGSGILAEAINMKKLTKNQPDPRIPTLIPCILTPIPRVPTLIPRVPTLISGVPTLIPRVPIIPLILFSNSPFWFLEIANKV